MRIKDGVDPEKVEKALKRITVQKIFLDGMYVANVFTGDCDICKKYTGKTVEELTREVILKHSPDGTVESALPVIQAMFPDDDIKNIIGFLVENEI